MSFPFPFARPLVFFLSRRSLSSADKGPTPIHMGDISGLMSLFVVTEIKVTLRTNSSIDQAIKQKRVLLTRFELPRKF